MHISSPWTHVTHSQLKQVPAPRPEDTGFLAATDSFTAGGAAAEARKFAQEADDQWKGGLFRAACSGLVGGTVAFLAATSGNSALALGAACAGAIGAVALAALGLPARSRREEWRAFERDVQPWAQSAARQLTKTGSAPGTVENHNFFAGGVFKQVYDIRNEAGSVVSRHVELENGVKLTEDVSQRTVTAETAQGTKILSGATLKLPKCSEPHYDAPHMLPGLTIKSDLGTEQGVDLKGNSDFTAGTSSHPVQVWPRTLVQEDGYAGVELPNGTLRFDYWPSDNGAARVLYATPLLNGRDFQQDFPVYEKETVPGRESRGQEVLSAHPHEAPPVGGWKFEPVEDHVVGHVMKLGPYRLEERVGETTLRKGDEVVFQGKGRLDIYRGTLKTKEVTQDLWSWPLIVLDVGGHKVTIDSEENISSATPATLIEGRWLQLGDRKVEIPVPRPPR